MNATYLLLAMATLGMLLSAITRATVRGVSVGELNQMPFGRHLLMGLNLPSMIALAAWAFLTFPWYIVLGGIVFFVTVFSLVLGFVLAPVMRSSARTEALNSFRPLLDVTLLAGTMILWTAFFPLGRV
jgi:hypothetical protein